MYYITIIIGYVTELLNNITSDYDFDPYMLNDTNGSLFLLWSNYSDHIYI